jgi:hypothetical protein
MVRKLHFQAALQGRIQQALQQVVIAAQRHLAGSDVLNLVQRTRRPSAGQPTPAAGLAARHAPNCRSWSQQVSPDKLVALLTQRSDISARPRAAATPQGGRAVV